jgi:hypothetical protein
MKYTRMQGEVNDSIDTHKTKWFNTIITKVQNKIFLDMNSNVDYHICDPFARNCLIANNYSNDMNKETKAKYHLDAKEFLKICPSEYFDLVIFDPPFSEVQAERKYGEAANIYTIPNYVPACMKEIQRILIPGGYFLKFGYNTNSCHTDFELCRIWNVHFAGNKNDVLVSLWQMNQTNLKRWI